MSETVLEIPEIRNIGWSKDRTAQTEGAPYPPGTVVISADSHLMEPENMWVDRVPPHLRDQAPQIWRDDVGFHMRIGDKDIPDLKGINLCAFECVPGAYDQQARLKDLDAEGVQAEILFPQRSLGFIRLPDLELRYWCLRAYNEYLSEFCHAAPGRFYGPGLLRFWDPAKTRDDLQEIKALGLKTVMIPKNPGEGVYYNSRAMDPFWDAIEEAELPVCIHIGENFPAGGRGAAATNALNSIGGFRYLWGLLAFGGVFDRHPTLQVIFAEGGISWVPSTIHDADMIYESYKPDMDPRLSHLPSYYWFNNCYATFMTDPAGLELMHRIGADRAMWASDYPHNEGTLGYTRSAVNDVFRYVGEEAGKAIVGGNAVRVFGLD